MGLSKTPLQTVTLFKDGKLPVCCREFPVNSLFRSCFTVRAGEQMLKVMALQYVANDQAMRFPVFFPVNQGSRKSGRVRKARHARSAGCLEMIRADFLAGANLESGNSKALLLSLERMVELLPSPQKMEFLEQIRSAS
jgi:hypothetical protein